MRISDWSSDVCSSDLKSGIRMTDKLGALYVLGRVARTGSFGAAGREMRLSQPSVSRIIAGLEGEVGVALLSRSTRAVTLARPEERRVAKECVRTGTFWWAPYHEQETKVYVIRI